MRLREGLRFAPSSELDFFSNITDLCSSTHPSSAPAHPFSTKPVPPHQGHKPWEGGGLHDQDQHRRTSFFSSRARVSGVSYVFEPAPPLAMPATERRLPPLLLLLPSVLLISCLDGAVGAAEEGGGLPSASPGDNGINAAVGDPSATDPTGPERFMTSPGTIAGTHPETKHLCWGQALLQHDS